MKVYRKKRKRKTGSTQKVRKAYVKVEPNAALAWELDYKGMRYECE